ncbi:hypothetical protein ZIOFF_043988 [Zingiber officinale]|uniref:Sugar phosphate transporter domain-containing protein n=1 Tax=Zingiber officinale TaxID=94328 RepID=A0A8J5FWE5_ZINOF|nr:hypothetical protein ZIOFF_043988 [Zingiber officinale]
MVRPDSTPGASHSSSSPSCSRPPASFSSRSCSLPKGSHSNSITPLYYVALFCFVFLLLPWSFIELSLRGQTAFRPDLLFFGINSFCFFALNLAVFLLVGKTFALTMNVAGVVKDWLLHRLLLARHPRHDTVTPINLFGYGVVILGVAYYNHAKLQALKDMETQKKAQWADEEAGKLLGEMKVHCFKYFYTLCVFDSEKANKLKQSLPPDREAKLKNY